VLRLRAVAQQRAHVVHLAMARAGVATRAIDLLHDDGRFREPETGAAVVLRDQRCEPAGFGQGVDEGFGIAALLVDLAEVLTRKLRAQRAHRVADVLVLIVGAKHCYEAPSVTSPFGPSLPSPARHPVVAPTAGSKCRLAPVARRPGTARSRKAATRP